MTKPSDIPQQVLDLARGRADSAEVIYQESEHRSVNFQDNRLKSVVTNAVRGVGLRVIHKGRIGFSATNDMDSLERLAQNALDSAAFGQEAKFQFPAQVSGVRKVKVYDDAVPRLRMDRAATLTREGIDHILAAFPDAHCGGGMSAEHGRTVICNSAGLFHEEKATGFGMGIGAFLVRGESFLSVDEGEDSCRCSEDIMRHARKVNEWIRFAAKEVRLGEEQMPVLFTPRALDFLLSTFEMNANGKMVQKGASILAKRLGEQVLDRRVSLWDDPAVDFAAGSMEVDSEGVAARRKPLFENGVLRTFIYDLQTAGMMGVPSTGNASRSYGGQPHPGLCNVRLSPGATPQKDLLAGIKRGLLIDAALGAGQSNILAGEFSVNVELGFLVENGEIVGRVKDCMLAGNAFDAFNRVRDLSAETEWHGAAEMPFVCFESLSVVGRGR